MAFHHQMAGYSLPRRQEGGQTMRRAFLGIRDNGATQVVRPRDLGSPKPEEWAMNKDDDDELLRLNVGGQSFLLFRSDILRNGPGSKLADFVLMDSKERRKHSERFLEASQEYFFARPSNHFKPVFELLVTGELHRMPGHCKELLDAELAYWRMSAKIPKCCHIDVDDSEQEFPVAIDEFQGKTLSSVRRAIWNVTEGINPSTLGSAFAILSNAIVIIALLCMILGTVHQFQVPASTTQDGGLSDAANSTAKKDMVPHPFLAIVETFCLAYFTVEYGVRFVVAPNKWRFVCGPLNIVDLIAIVPFLFDVILPATGLNAEQLSRVRWLLPVTRIVRVLRVMRVAKLGRHSPGVRNFAATIHRSRAQLKMAFGVVIAGVLFFSSLVYYCEKDERDTPFTSIPAAFWWCVVTMTTVGYGDVVPRTVAGKLVSSGAIVCGVMVLALPITIIISNFIQVAKVNG